MYQAGPRNELRRRPSRLWKYPEDKRAVGCDKKLLTAHNSNTVLATTNRLKQNTYAVNQLDTLCEVNKMQLIYHSPLTNRGTHTSYSCIRGTRPDVWNGKKKTYLLFCTYTRLKIATVNTRHSCQ
ncbi:hypothetical protein Pelo_6354 [Pelomyxa schiedti]|nr:hypothetical protein Pelo_6354 [Pelomyxa schiedti]